MPLPFQRRPGAQLRPSFSRDFAGLKTLDHGVGPAITFTRASNATFFDASGVLQTASNDAPRFDHDPATGASRGLLIEEARTNSIRNSQAGGSTNGVIGSGGALPTNWGSAIPAGIAFEVMGSGTSGGLDYVDVKISGTNSSGSTAVPIISFENTTQIVASNTQTWTGSLYLSLSAGSLSGASSFIVDVVERDSGGNFLASNSTGFTPTGTISRVSHTRTFNNASTARTNHRAAFSVANGNTIDLTLRIAAPQLEQGAFPTSYIPTTNAAATRSADFARVTPISSFYNQSEGTAFAEYSRFQISANSKALLFLDNATPSRYLGIESTADGTASRFISQNNAGSTVASLSYGNAAANTVYKQIGTYKENDFIAAQNGTLTSADTSGTPTDTLDRMGVGCLPGVGNFPLNGHIRKIAYYPKRLSNTLLQQLTT